MNRALYISVVIAAIFPATKLVLSEETNIEINVYHSIKNNIKEKFDTELIDSINFAQQNRRKSNKAPLTQADIDIIKQVLGQKYYQMAIDFVICNESVSDNNSSKLRNLLSSCMKNKYNEWQSIVAFAMYNKSDNIKINYAASICEIQYKHYSYMIKYPPYDFLNFDGLYAYDWKNLMNCVLENIK